MASKRDLVEAHAFNRRRLVSAFLSGAPGGREVEPARPARAVVGGAALAALVLAGSAVFGFLRPGLPADWNQNKLITVKDTGARFVATDDKILHPVANVASARLLIPADDFGVRFASAEQVAGQKIGESVGIVGGPDNLPTPDQMIQTGWTSCIDAQGATLLRLATRPGAEPLQGSVAKVVTSGSSTFVIWGSYRYPVATDLINPVLQALRLNGSVEQDVPGPWLDLFPEGPPLGPVRVDGAGSPYPGAGAPAGAVLGSALSVASADGVRRQYLLGPEGLVELTPVAMELYGISPDRQPLLEVNQPEVASLPTSRTPLYPQLWPAEIPTPYEEEAACALLTAADDELPTVQLARPTDEAAVPDAGRPSAVVQNDHGALVRAISGTVTDSGTIFLVDSTARRFAFGTPIGEVTARLGYARTPPALVPIAWAAALGDGPELSISAAQQPVRAGQGTP